MKRLSLLIASAAICATAFAFPKALYVKKGDTYAKYNFGVAENLKFTNGGKTLTITGYDEAIDLSQIDYITFSAPVDNTTMTPEANKEMLLQTGDEFMKAFSPEMAPEQIRMVDIFVREYVTYYLDPQYYDVHSSDQEETPMNNVRAFMESIGSMLRGNAAAARTAKLNGVELYQCSDWYGVFEANRQTRTWDKIADADYLEIRFQSAGGEMYSVRFTASDEYTDWTEVDFVGRVPKAMNVVGRLGNATRMFTTDIATTVDNTAKTVDLFLSFNAATYKVENSLLITNDYMADNVKVVCSGREMLNATSRVKGIRLTDYDNWKEDIDNTHDGYDNYGPDGYEWIEGTREPMIAHHFTYATADVDILGRLQVSGKVSSIGHLYDISNEDSDLGYISNGVWDDIKNTCTYIYDDINVLQKQAAHFNDFSDISFSYDHNGIVQGYLTWDVSEDIDSWETDGYWDETAGEYIQRPHTHVSIYYDVMPLLVFPDQTSFAITDYFNEDSFSRLVDDYNEIIDTYYSVSGNTRPSDDNYGY